MTEQSEPARTVPPGPYYTDRLGGRPVVVTPSESAGRTDAGRFVCLTGYKLRGDTCIYRFGVIGGSRDTGFFEVAGDSHAYQPGATYRLTEEDPS